MGSSKEKQPPLQQGLVMCMKALDSQIARRMQRSPAEREVHGVQKWEPYGEKIEEVAAIVLNSLGEDEVTLDSVLVLSQAFVKTLYLLTEELGEEGLGQIRAAYCRVALEQITRDAQLGLVAAGNKPQVN